jgi:hypothetical protein
MNRTPWLLCETEPGDGGTPEPPPAPAPAPEPEPEPTPTEPPEGFVPAAEFEDLQQRFAELEPLADFARTLPADALAPPGYGVEPQVEEQLPPDPSVDPIGFKQWLDADRQQFQQELMGRFDPMMQDAHMRRAETQLDQALTALPDETRSLGLPEEHQERAWDAIEHLTAAFLPVDLADQVANLPPEYAQRVVEQQLGAAAQQAGEYLGELLELARGQGRDAYIASLQGGEGGEQAREPAVAGAGIPGNAPAGSYEEIVGRYLGS